MQGVSNPLTPPIGQSQWTSKALLTGLWHKKPSLSFRIKRSFFKGGRPSVSPYTTPSQTHGGYSGNPHPFVTAKGVFQPPRTPLWFGLFAWGKAQIKEHALWAIPKTKLLGLIKLDAALSPPLRLFTPNGFGCISASPYAEYIADTLTSAPLLCKNWIPYRGIQFLLNGSPKQNQVIDSVMRVKLRFVRVQSGVLNPASANRPQASRPKRVIKPPIFTENRENCAGRLEAEFERVSNFGFLPPEYGRMGFIAPEMRPHPEPMPRSQKNDQNGGHGDLSLKWTNRQRNEQK